MIIILKWIPWKFIVPFFLIYIFEILGRGHLHNISRVLYASLGLWALYNNIKSFHLSIRNHSAKARTGFLGLSLLLVGPLALLWVIAAMVDLGIETYITSPPKNLNVELLRENAVQIEDLYHISPLVLSKIGEAVKGKPVVALGESNHVTREYPVLKTSIIRYLHEHEGFDVLMMEAPTAPLEIGQKKMRETGDPTEVLKGMFYLWRYQEIADLMKYVLETEQTDHPLRLIGFDRQDLLIGANSGWHWVDDFLIEASALVDSTMAFEQSSVVSSWLGFPMPGEADGSKASWEDKAECHFRDLAKWYKKEAEDFATVQPKAWEKLILAGMVCEGLVEDIQGLHASRRELFDSRDKRMAQNADYLRSELFPESRIIIWAHNAHLHKSPSNYEIVKYDLFGMFDFWEPLGWSPLYQNFGENLVQAWGDDIYVMGLLAGGGHVGIFRGGKLRANVRAPRKDSIEGIMRSTESSALFLDFAQVESELAANTLYLSFLSRGWLKTKINDQFDGIIVVKNISAPRRLSMKSTPAKDGSTAGVNGI